MLPTFALDLPGQPQRITSYRDPGTNPKDAVVWIHGRDGSGENLISTNTRPSADRIDVGTNALVLPLPGSPKMWVTPGDAGDGMPMPAGVSPGDDRYDLRYHDAVVEAVFVRFPSVERVWVFGFSSGAKMTFGLSGYNSDVATYPHLAQVRGYFMASHTPPHALEWPKLPKTPKPIGMWWGGAEPNPPDPRFPTFEQSFRDVCELNKVSVLSREEVVKRGCCGMFRPLRRVKGLDGICDTVRYVRARGGHEITTCSGCVETEYAVQFFSENGLGA